MNYKRAGEVWNTLFPTHPFPKMESLTTYELHNIGLLLNEYDPSHPIIAGSGHILGMFVYSEPVNQSVYYIDPYFMILIHDPKTNTYIFDDTSFHYALTSKWLDDYEDIVLVDLIRQEFKHVTEEWRKAYLVECVFCAENINGSPNSPRTLIPCNKCYNCFAHQMCIEKWKDVSKGDELLCPQCRVIVDKSHAWENIKLLPSFVNNPIPRPIDQLQPSPKKDCHIM